MAIVQHRFIRSREEFFSVLQQATDTVRRFHQDEPSLPTWAEIVPQLEAMDAWTKLGRPPTKEERRKIAIGVRLTKTFDPPPTVEIQEIVDLLAEVEWYFKWWLSDQDWNALDNDDFEIYFPDDHAP